MEQSHDHAIIFSLSRWNTDTGRNSQLLLCPTVSEDLHFLFQPRNNSGNGTFAYRMLNGSFNLTYRRGLCGTVAPTRVCDQLVMVYVAGSPEEGEFQIRYTSNSFPQLLVPVVFGKYTVLVNLFTKEVWTNCFRHFPTEAVSKSVSFFFCVCVCVLVEKGVCL